MDYSISKTFRFEASHRLTTPYSGKCSHLHGHSWSVRLTLRASELDSRGFVEDFSELRPFKEWIDEHLDHATLVASSDTALFDWLRANGQKHYRFDPNPTSEVIARTLYQVAEGLGFSVFAVEVKETCTSTAQYQPRERFEMNRIGSRKV